MCGMTLIRPDIYDEPVETRKRVRLLEEQNHTLREELRWERGERNRAVEVAGRAFLHKDENFLTIRCMLDPMVLRHAYNTRDAFNHIVAGWFEELWAAYRDTELPPKPTTDAGGSG